MTFSNRQLESIPTYRDISPTFRQKTMEHLHLARGRTNHLFRWRSIAARIITTVTMLATDESIDEHTPNNQARAVIMSNFARAADTRQVTGSFMDEDFGYTQTPSSTSRMASSSLGVSANRPIMKSSFVPSSHCRCCIAKKIVCILPLNRSTHVITASRMVMFVHLVTVTARMPHEG